MATKRSEAPAWGRGSSLVPQCGQAARGRESKDQAVNCRRRGRRMADVTEGLHHCQAAFRSAKLAHTGAVAQRAPPAEHMTATREFLRLWGQTVNRESGPWGQAVTRETGR